MRIIIIIIIVIINSLTFVRDANMELSEGPHGGKVRRACPYRGASGFEATEGVTRKGAQLLVRLRYAKCSNEDLAKSGLVSKRVLEVKGVFS